MHTCALPTKPQLLFSCSITCCLTGISKEYLKEDMVEVADLVAITTLFEMIKHLEIARTGEK